MPSFKQLCEWFRRLTPLAQIILSVCVLIVAAGIVTLFILVAINPLSLGSVVALITTVVNIMRGRGNPPRPG